MSESFAAAKYSCVNAHRLAEESFSNMPLHRSTKQVHMSKILTVTHRSDSPVVVLELECRSAVAVPAGFAVMRGICAGGYLVVAIPSRYVSYMPAWQMEGSRPPYQPAEQDVLETPVMVSKIVDTLLVKPTPKENRDG